MKRLQRTIAVVEDDERLLKSLESLLISFGYLVRPHLSGESLLSCGDVRKIDCLISDVGMPGMSGIQLLQHVHSERPDLPVILITGRKERHLSQLAFQHGTRHFFEKPLDSIRLIEAVRSELTTAP